MPIHYEYLRTISHIKCKDVSIKKLTKKYHHIIYFIVISVELCKERQVSEKLKIPLTNGKTVNFHIVNIRKKLVIEKRKNKKKQNDTFLNLRLLFKIAQNIKKQKLITLCFDVSI